MSSRGLVWKSSLAPPAGARAASPQTRAAQGKPPPRLPPRCAARGLGCALWYYVAQSAPRLRSAAPAPCCGRRACRRTWGTGPSASSGRTRPEGMEGAEHGLRRSEPAAASTPRPRHRSANAHALLRARRRRVAVPRRRNTALRAAAARPHLLGHVVGLHHVHNLHGTGVERAAVSTRRRRRRCSGVAPRARPGRGPFRAVQGALRSPAGPEARHTQRGGLKPMHRFQCAMCHVCEGRHVCQGRHSSM